MLAGLIIVPVVSLYLQSPKRSSLRTPSLCYEKKVPAAQKNSLD